MKNETQTVTKADIEAVRLRDHEAFRKVYLNTIGPLTGFLQILLHSREEAEDIAQNVFTYIWENIDTVDPSKNFNGYLYIIAKNMAFKHLARKKLYDKYYNYTMHSSTELDSSTDEVVMSREMALLVNIYIDNMPAQRKRVFELHNNEHKSSQEIASMLDISVNTVRTHLNLAQKGLKELVALAGMFFFSTFDLTSMS